MILFMPDHTPEIHPETSFVFRRYNRAYNFPENTYIYCTEARSWQVTYDRAFRLISEEHHRVWVRTDVADVPKNYRTHVLLLSV